MWPHYRQIESDPSFGSGGFGRSNSTWHFPELGGGGFGSGGEIRGGGFRTGGGF
jgi:hypothetical protein